MPNLNLYCLSLKYFSLIDKLPSYIKPLGLGTEEYPRHWLTEKSGENIGWGDVATVGLKSRTTASVTQSIANNAASNVSISTAKGFVLYSIETSHAAWVTIYTSNAARFNDASRSETTDPLPGSGVVAEIITTGDVTQPLTPAPVGFNNDNPMNASIFVKIVNKSGINTAITYTLTYVQLEA